VSSAKRRARKKGLRFDLTVGEVVGMWPKDSHCPVFGTVMSPCSGRGGGQSDHSPTLDRVTPEHGYVWWNIQIISDLANRLKSSVDSRKLRRMAQWVEYQEWKRAGADV
jgi:hypothetical protein